MLRDRQRFSRACRRPVLYDMHHRAADLIGCLRILQRLPPNKRHAASGQKQRQKKPPADSGISLFRFPPAKVAAGTLPAASAPNIANSVKCAPFRTRVPSNPVRKGIFRSHSSTKLLLWADSAPLCREFQKINPIHSTIRMEYVRTNCFPGARLCIFTAIGTVISAFAVAFIAAIVPISAVSSIFGVQSIEDHAIYRDVRFP